MNIPRIDRDAVEITAAIVVIATFAACVSVVLAMAWNHREIEDNGLVMLIVGTVIGYMGAYVVGRGDRRRARREDE